MTRIAAGAVALLGLIWTLGGLLAGGVQGAPTADGDLDPTFGTGAWRRCACPRR